MRALRPCFTRTQHESELWKCKQVRRLGATHASKSSALRCWKPKWPRSPVNGRPNVSQPPVASLFAVFATCKLELRILHIARRAIGVPC